MQFNTRNTVNLQVGWVFKCQMEPNTKEYKKAVIEEIKVGTKNQKTYYVHFVGFDRRLDRWITSDAMDLNPEAIRANRATKGHQWLFPKHKKITRSRKRKFSGFQDTQKHEEKYVKHFTKRLEQVVIGKYDIDTWYFSPYAEEIVRGRTKIYLCEFCLKYMRKKKTLKRHFKKCKYYHPPGDEIYRHGKYSFWEINGSNERLYCQNLCLMAKLFLEEKNIYCDVDGFLFYVLTENDDKGSHIVGYFSKEKNSLNNLSCIIIIPPYQRKGFGNFIIQFSYELSKIEKKVGGPEKPLSDLGALGYHSYWNFTILEILKTHDRGTLSIDEISEITSMTPRDIIETFERLNLIKLYKGSQVIHVPDSVMKAHVKKSKKATRRIIADKIHWTPYKFNFKYKEL